MKIEKLCMVGSMAFAWTVFGTGIGRLYQFGIEEKIEKIEKKMKNLLKCKMLILIVVVVILVAGSCSSSCRIITGLFINFIFYLEGF